MTLANLGKRPFLVPLGIEMQFHFGIALKKEFNWPVVGYVTSQYAQRSQTPELAAQYDHIFSFPDFYKENKNFLKSADLATLNARQVEIERRYGLPTSALLASYDRDITSGRDYLTVRRRQLAYLMFADLILSRIKPIFVWGTLATFGASVITLACKSMGVPYVINDTPRINERIAFSRDDFGWDLLPETMERLTAGKADEYPAEVLREADAWYEEFVSRPITPDYTVLNSRMRFSLRKSLGNALEALQPALLKTLFTDRVDQAMGSYANPLRCLGNGLVSRIKATTQTRGSILDSNPDLERPYFYFPLHQAPEISDMVQGSMYDNPDGFLFQLAKRIPSDAMLYVKEHPGMIGRRSTAFFKRLATIYNVRLISPSVDTFTLTRKSRAVITVTGTAGLEAFLFCKPVVVLGKVFFRHLPQVLGCDFDEHFCERLTQYLESFDPDPAVRRNAARLMFLLSYPFGANHFFYGSAEADQQEIDREGSTFAKCLRAHLVQRHPVMEGDFAPEFLEALYDGGSRQGA